MSHTQHSTGGRGVDVRALWRCHSRVSTCGRDKEREGLAGEAAMHARRPQVDKCRQGINHCNNFYLFIFEVGTHISTAGRQTHRRFYRVKFFCLKSAHTTRPRVENEPTSQVKEENPTAEKSCMKLTRRIKSYKNVSSL